MSGLVLPCGHTPNHEHAARICARDEKMKDRKEARMKKQQEREEAPIVVVFPVGIKGAPRDKPEAFLNPHWKSGSVSTQPPM